MHKAILFPVAALLLAGCVRDRINQLTDDQAIITARGSAFNDTGDVAKKMLVAAANLTTKNGYTSFEITNAQGGESTSYVQSGQVGTTTTNGTYVASGNVLTGGSQTTTYTSPTVLSPIRKPSGMIAIKMFRGGCAAGDPNCYDAQDVLRHAHG